MTAALGLLVALGELVPGVFVAAGVLATGIAAYGRGGRAWGEVAGFGFLVAGAALMIAVALVKVREGSGLAPAGTLAGGGLEVVACALGGAWLARSSGHRRLRVVVAGSSWAAWIMAATSVVQALTTSGARIEGWQVHPNIWAAAAVVPALLPLALGDRGWLGATALAAGLTTAAAAGSRTALLGLVVGMAGLAVVGLRGARGTVVLRWSVVLLVFAATGLALQSGRWLPLIDAVRHPDRLLVSVSSTRSGNLLSSRGQAVGVTVSPDAAGATREASVTVTKAAGAGWSRLQHEAVLVPGTTYTLTVEMSAISQDGRPGLLGYGRVGSIRPRLEVDATTGEVIDVGGGLAVESVDVRPQEGGWHATTITFRYDGEAPVHWWVGPAPDLRSGTTGGGVEVRRFMLGVGSSAQPFVEPGTEDLALRQALDRVTAFRAAWRGFLARPWFGQPLGSFAGFARGTTVRDAATDVLHAHDLVLQTLFETGAVGALALALLLTGLARLAHAAGPGLAIVFACVMLLNLVDLTFWSSGQALVLATTAAMAHGART